jgi:hypothetical protein
MEIRDKTQADLEARIRRARNTYARNGYGKLGGLERYARVELPPGRWMLDTPLTLAGALGVHIQGAGSDATQLVVRQPMPSAIALTDTTRGGLSHLGILVQADCAAAVVLGRATPQERQAELGLPTPTLARLEDVVIDCGAYEKDGQQRAWGKVAVAFSDAGSPGLNENNDCATLRNVAMQNYQTAACSFQGNQSKEHLLDGCRFDGNGFGRAGIWSAGGGWRAVGCGGGGHTMADVLLADTGDSITMVGFHGESSRKFIDQPNRTGVPMAVTLIGCEWMADQLHADGNMIRIQGPGPLTLIGGHYGSGHQPTPHIAMDPFANEPASFTCQGVTFGAYGHNRESDNPFRLPTLCERNIIGNLYADHRPGREGMAVARPEWSRQGWGP